MIVNGRQQEHIEIADRAFQYGDGCFTTMAFRNSQLEFFDAHIERLKFASKTLYLDFNKWSELAICIVDSLKSKTDCVVKVMITRGQGGRGYNPEGAVNPSYIITHHAIPAEYKLWQNKGINLTISPITLANQPLLAGIKHLNRLEQVLVKHALSQTSYVDAVVCDSQHNIVESSAGNVFWFKDNVWYTADLSCSGVEGVMRNQIIAIMQEQGLECQVVKHNVNTLFNAQQLFVCNCLMQLVPVLSLFNPSNNQSKSYVVDRLKQIQNVIELKAAKI